MDLKGMLSDPSVLETQKKSDQSSHETSHQRLQELRRRNTLFTPNTHNTDQAFSLPNHPEILSASHLETHPEQPEPSCPDRTPEELKTIAQAYLTVGNHKDLSADIKADIKGRPFTDTELLKIKEHLKTAQNENQINKKTRKKLSKIIQQQSKAGKATKERYWANPEAKRKKEKYEQSNKGKQIKKKYQQSNKGRVTRQRYQQSEQGRLTEAKREEKRTDAQIREIEGVNILQPEDLGISSQNFTPSGTGSFSTFELSKNDQEE